MNKISLKINPNFSNVFLIAQMFDDATVLAWLKEDQSRYYRKSVLNKNISFFGIQLKSSLFVIFIFLYGKQSLCMISAKSKNIISHFKNIKRKILRKAIH